jgi:hypothetical protein
MKHNVTLTNLPMVARLLAAVYAVSCLLTFAGCQRGQMPILGAQNGPLDNEQGCGRETDHVIADQGWNVDMHSTSSKPLYVVTHHFNHKFQRCFVKAEMFGPSTKVIADFNADMVTLIDAFEPDHQYGTYVNNSAVGVSVCQVTLPSGQDIVCHSRQEFEDLIQPLMWQ